MRRLLLSMMALSSLSVMMGCSCYRTSGICDCAYDDYCSSRTPWIRHTGGHVETPGVLSTVPAGVPVTTPTTLPKAMPSSTPKMPPAAPEAARDLPPIVTPAKGF